MAKTILIPTDLQIGSLNALRSALASGSDEVQVILMHAVHLPDGITDLLFHSPKRDLHQRLSPSFKEALAILRNHHEQRIASIDVLPFHGITQRAFDQFLKINGVVEVHTSSTYVLQGRSRGMDPMPFITGSAVHHVVHGMITTDGTQQPAPAVDHLQLLFER